MAVIPLFAASVERASQKDEWLEAFDKDFWPDYPRKIGKKAARKAWLGVRPWTQETCDALFAGLARWKRYWREHETAIEYIPYPATWLNQGRHEDEP